MFRWSFDSRINAFKETRNLMRCEKNVKLMSDQLFSLERKRERHLVLMRAGETQVAHGRQEVSMFRNNCQDR